MEVHTARPYEKAVVGFSNIIGQKARRPQTPGWRLGCIGKARRLTANLELPKAGARGALSSSPPAPVSSPARVLSNKISPDRAQETGIPPLTPCSSSHPSHHGAGQELGYPLL